MGEKIKWFFTSKLNIPIQTHRHVSSYKNINQLKQFKMCNYRLETSIIITPNKILKKIILSFTSWIKKKKKKKKKRYQITRSWKEKNIKAKKKGPKIDTETKTVRENALCSVQTHTKKRNKETRTPYLKKIGNEKQRLDNRKKARRKRNSRDDG